MIGILTDKFGRRKTIQIFYLPMALSWLLITFANSYMTILFGRIVLGIPFGEFLHVISKIYITKYNSFKVSIKLLRNFMATILCSALV